ncbi:hypothetical protein [Guptibacillus hwajinpoensis]|uniref:hypothetical protein n=1 Tax=Guptibacillus hwajinpoensis TaxID=208199 RepID=UPI00147082FB|nr:hypothetical protein [Alkalihalobacillus macyae]
MKAVSERIFYYTKKVAEYTAIHPTRYQNPYRYNRLLSYKKELNHRIKEAK